jgi:signal transduction histidine kinase
MPSSRHRSGAAESAATGTGNGLLGMRERTAAVGGTLIAAPGPGESFCVEAELPLRESPQP